MTFSFLLEHKLIEERKIENSRLTRADFELLMKPPLLWDTMAVPFIIPGHKLFPIEIHPKDSEEEKILKVLYDLTTFFNNDLFLELTESKPFFRGGTSLKVVVDKDVVLSDSETVLDEKIYGRSSGILKKTASFIRPEKAIIWAILRGHSLAPELQNVLGIFQAVTTGKKRDLQIAATTQTLFFLDSNMKQTGMIKRLQVDYFALSKNKLYDIVVEIDPISRQQGAPRKNQPSIPPEFFEPKLIREVVRIEYDRKKVNLEKVIIVCESILETLLKEGVAVSEDQIIEYPLIKRYIGDLHPIIQSLVKKYLKRTYQKHSK
jgi:hypothetical protein